MTNAKRDNNQITTLLATSSVDGITPERVQADPSLHSLLVDNLTEPADLSDDDARRDENSVTVLLAVSNVDGVTPVPIYVTNNKLLIKPN